MKRNSISKEETARLINHALASSKKVTNRRIGELINEPDSRVSQGKSGEWSLTREQAELLIDLFGQPRSNSGEFIRGETAKSIEDFINNEANLSKLRHWEKLIRVMSCRQTKTRLFEIISGEQQRLRETYRDLSGEVVSEPAKPEEAKIFANFNEFLSTNEFKRWMSFAKNWMLKALECIPEYEELLWKSKGLFFYNIDVLDKLPIPVPNDCNLPFDQSLTTFSQKKGICLEGFNAVGLMLLGDFYHQLNSPKSIEYPGLPESYAFCESLPSFEASEITDYVMTGDVVWEQQGYFSSPKKGRSVCDGIVVEIPEYNSLLPPVFRRGDSLVPEKTAQSCQVDCWTTYSVKLYVNENCDYSLLIELGQQKPTTVIPEPYHWAERHIVIPKILGRELFNHLSILREWLELKALPEIEIKKNIAKAGGFIPGAKVL